MQILIQILIWNKICGHRIVFTEFLIKKKNKKSETQIYVHVILLNAQFLQIAWSYLHLLIVVKGCAKCRPPCVTAQTGTRNHAIPVSAAGSGNSDPTYSTPPTNTIVNNEFINFADSKFSKFMFTAMP